MTAATGKHQPFILLSALVCLLPLILVGCRQVSNYRYTPTVQEVTPSGASQHLGIRSFVTIDEIKAGETDGAPGQVSFRLRVENRGSSTVQLLQDQVDLISEDLQRFGKPDIEPSDGDSFTVKPSGSLLVQIRFPLPASDTHPTLRYRQFTLLWSLTVDGNTYSNSTTFTRTRRYRDPRHREPYWDHHWYHYDDYPYYRYPYHSGFRFHYGRWHHW